MIGFSLYTFLLYILVQDTAQAADSDCTARGGSCIVPLPFRCSDGSYHTGLCSGWFDSCCVPDDAVKPSCTERTGLVKFYIQRASTLGSTYYTVNNVASIPSAHLQGRIHIVTHGWTQNAQELQDLGYELFRNKGPAILVDWSVWSGDSDADTYIPACRATSDVGGEVAQFIVELEKRGFSRSNMHLIGFSLGGKVSAQAGDCLNGQVARLTGLDTPLYCVDKDFTHPSLDDGDAQFVDTIRTTFLSGAYFQAQGHADFFAGCTYCTCFSRGFPWTVSGRHSEALNMFKNSIGNSDCQIDVSKSCICPIPICSSNDNTMGYPASKPSSTKKYMVSLDGKDDCKN